MRLLFAIIDVENQQQLFNRDKFKNKQRLVVTQ